MGNRRLRGLALIKETLASKEGNAFFIFWAAIFIIGIIVLFFLLVKPQFLGFSKPSESQPTPTLTPTPTLLQPTLSPQPTPTPQPPKTQVRNVNLGENFTMRFNDEIEIAGTGLRIRLVDYKIPPEGTFDLPYYVTLRVNYQESVEEFTLIVGGLQPAEIANRRRQKTVFGYNFFVQKVIETEVTLRVVRVEGLDVCQAEWYGYVFNPDIGKCELRSATGCNSPFQYKTKEECENAR